MSRRIAIYGGTFDPVHYGHLKSIEELRIHLSIDEIKLIPSFVPPHRSHPGATATQRVEMLRLATAEFPKLAVDDREVRRSGISYSIDTVSELRREQGDEVELFFVMGADAFALIHEWHEWQALTDYCHLVVMDRPGASALSINPLVLEWLEDKLEFRQEALDPQGFGQVLKVQLSQWDISATAIRRRIAQQASTHLLLPEAVASYIDEQNLYRA